ncbi:hypothetical protein [Desulfoscipio gibsoniae]
MSSIIIILIIAYVIMSKFMGRDGRNMPERSAGRLPEDIEQSFPDYAASRSDDGPLTGPWNTSPRSSDGPLPGPWNTSAGGGEDGPLPGPWEPDSPPAAEDKPRLAPEPEDEPRTPRREREQTYSAVVPASELGEKAYAGPRKHSRAAAAEGMACSIDHASAASLQPSPAAPRQRHAANPLAVALRSKRALVGSMIIGELLNSRGGRIKRKPGQF